MPPQAGIEEVVGEKELPHRVGTAEKAGEAPMRYCYVVSSDTGGVWGTYGNATAAHDAAERASIDLPTDTFSVTKVRHNAGPSADTRQLAAFRDGKLQLFMWRTWSGQ